MSQDNVQFWEQEMLIGYINATPTRKTCVYICEKDGNHYVNLTAMYCTKKDPTWKHKSAFSIPFQSAQQVAALMSRAVNEGQKLMWK